MKFLGGCLHAHTTFPLTPINRKTGRRDTTYICCLDCGREFEYDWGTSRIGAEIRRKAEVTFQGIILLVLIFALVLVAAAVLWKAV